MWITFSPLTRLIKDSGRGFLWWFFNYICILPQKTKQCERKGFKFFYLRKYLNCLTQLN